MRKMMVVVFGFIWILAFSLSSASITNAGDFWIEQGTLAPRWSAESAGEFPFETSAIAFDSEDNVYTNDIVEDWNTGTLRILRGEVPDSNEWDEFVSFLGIHDVVSGLDFDAKGNLFVSVVIAKGNPFDYLHSDAGLIRKVRAHSLKVSDPIEFVDIPSVDDF